jgi:hypothetical protein
MLTKLQRAPWRDWVVPVQVLLGIAALGVAIAQASSAELTATPPEPRPPLGLAR